MAVVSSVEGGEKAFVMSPVEGKASEGDEAVAENAKKAKENTGADFGCSVSAIETDPESGRSFVLVSLADSEKARVAKVFAEENEGAKQLAGAAVTKLCEMLGETAVAGALINPNPAEKEKKKYPVLPIVITVIGIAAAVIISVLVALFAGQKTEDDERTTAGNNNIHPQQNMLIQAVVEATTEAVTEEFTDNRGGSGIGEETELTTVGVTAAPSTEKVTQAEKTTVKPAVTNAPTKPVVTVTKAPTAPAATEESKPTAAPTTRKPTEPTTADKTQNVSGKFVFTSYGWGHGVGMSQEGAIAMAKNGKDYKQILANYYPGTTVRPDSSVPETVRYGGTEYGLIEYLCKTSYREIGNNVPKEAIKAQIVAVYTFAKTYGFDVDSSRHAFSPSWAYENTATHKACLEVMGMADATDTPKAVYVDYNGAPAFTCYFASAAGQTASASSVWGGSYPYLSGGASSPETVEVATLEISAEEMKKLIESYDSGIVLGDDPSEWIKIISHDSAYSENIGYASVVRVGNKEMRGNRFRGEVCDYRLRSHCFTVEYVK